MNKEQAAKIVLQLVENKQGVKATELAPYLVENQDIHYPWVDLIYELIQKGELVEVEYVLPQLNYRAKSFLLPKGATVNVIASGKTTFIDTINNTKLESKNEH
jgi:hypothetical protein